MTAPALAVSAEGRRLIDEHRDAWKAVGEWRPQAGNFSPRQHVAVNAASDLFAYVAKLEAALAPFAEHAQCWPREPDDMKITTTDGESECASMDPLVGDFRRAAQAMEATHGK